MTLAYRKLFTCACVGACVLLIWAVYHLETAPSTTQRAYRILEHNTVFESFHDDNIISSELLLQPLKRPRKAAHVNDVTRRVVARPQFEHPPRWLERSVLGADDVIAPTRPEASQAAGQPPRPAGGAPVTDCVTGEPLGAVPAGVDTGPLIATALRPTREASAARQAAFVRVYERRAWGHSWDQRHAGFNASGRGATVRWAKEAMRVLDVVVRRLKVQLNRTRVRLLDTSCGDMAWMSRFLSARRDIDYTGVDIVPAIIARHRATYRDEDWRFVHGDILTVPLLRPDAALSSYDLILCRMTLQHLYADDVIRLLRRFSASGAGYLLATTFSKADANADSSMDDAAKNPGRFRELNLEIEPVSLTPPLCLRRDGPLGEFDGWRHLIGLWRLPLQRVRGCTRPRRLAVVMDNATQTLFSCVDWSVASAPGG